MIFFSHDSTSMQYFGLPLNGPSINLKYTFKSIHVLAILDPGTPLEGTMYNFNGEIPVLAKPRIFPLSMFNYGVWRKHNCYDALCNNIPLKSELRIHIVLISLSICYQRFSNML